MTRDEIMRTAREACDTKFCYALFTDAELGRFAEIVAAGEREACARLCDELAERNRVSPTDSLWQWGECAAAIRARGGV